MDRPPVRIAIVGAGPAGLTLALALAARPSLHVDVFERAADHRSSATFNPDRSYTIDITGHGLKAARYVGLTRTLDHSLIPFLGIRARLTPLTQEERCKEPGWTGSRGDICRALLSELLERTKGSDCVTVHFDTEATLVSAAKATLLISDGSGSREASYDLVVGCDGAGSAVRSVLQEQVRGFTVTSCPSLTNHSTMLHLDLKSGTDALDPRFLYILSPPPVMLVAGAICGPKGPTDPLWFCQVGLSGAHRFSSVDEAMKLLTGAYRSITKLCSMAAIEAFSRRESVPIGRSKECSAMHGGRVVLLGDAGAPFPPVGQGVNAAMEAATVLDTCIGLQLGNGGSTADVLEAAARDFTRAWAPEASAIRTIARGLEYNASVFFIPRSVLYLRLGVSALHNAKDGNLSYIQALAIQRRADRCLGIAAVTMVSTLAAVCIWYWYR